MNKTRIDYLTHSWNPLKMRCTPISEGCAHCWHLAMARRLAGNPRLSDEVRAAYAGDGVVLSERVLKAPLGRTKPARIGVQFMGDLFFEDVPFAYVDKVMQVIASVPQHTFLILTKRAQRMFAYFHGENVLDCFPPLKNLWVGVTAENQRRYEERLPWLLQVPALVRFVSLEPLLDRVDLGLDGTCPKDWGVGYRPISDLLHWVIIGGESGPGARPMHPEWTRGIRDQCQEAGVPFFFKQWGCNAPFSEWEYNDNVTLKDQFWMHWAGMKSTSNSRPSIPDSGWKLMARMEKHTAGRLLDGREWSEYPEVLT